MYSIDKSTCFFVYSWLVYSADSRDLWYHGLIYLYSLKSRYHGLWRGALIGQFVDCDFVFIWSHDTATSMIILLLFINLSTTAHMFLLLGIYSTATLEKLSTAVFDCFYCSKNLFCCCVYWLKGWFYTHRRLLIYTHKEFGLCS
jgi:hypothetical protein